MTRHRWDSGTGLANCLNGCGWQRDRGYIPAIYQHPNKPMYDDRAPPCTPLDGEQQ